MIQLNNYSKLNLPDRLRKDIGKIMNDMEHLISIFRPSVASKTQCPYFKNKQNTPCISV